MTTNLLVRVAATILPIVTVTALGACAASPDQGRDTPDQATDGQGDRQSEDGPIVPADDSTPASCADVAAAASATLDDGEYLLFFGGDANQPWVAYCAGMASGAGQEYLSLHRTTDANFAQYTVGGAVDGTDVRTSYTKVRIDPVTLQVDINDKTFATSSGATQVGDSPVTSMAFGSGASCDEAASGLGNIDLRGTPFAIAADAFVLEGYEPVGGATLGADNQVADLTGGGYCGDISARDGKLQLVYPSAE